MGTPSFLYRKENCCCLCNVFCPPHLKATLGSVSFQGLGFRHYLCLLLNGCLEA